MLRSIYEKILAGFRTNNRGQRRAAAGAPGTPGPDGWRWKVSKAEG